ncbi:MAG: hypothetical protein GX946_03800 [Oligosphaeraceae bacterium]|nr:hypothetical protein [Oligosphaeraceae bacterium]
MSEKTSNLLKKTFMVPGVLKFILLCGLAATLHSSAVELTTPSFLVLLNDENGAVARIAPEKGHSLKSIHNEYRVMARSGDLFAGEYTDRVINTSTSNEWQKIYECTNPELPEITIIKRYRIGNNGLLERELEFHSSASEPLFLQIFTSSRFTSDYQKSGYWFGAGYLGPYQPVPKVRSARRVDEYVQSSKGMVFIHNDGKMSYAHYRTNINDTPVWPWWNSSINSYREKSDRLYYLPDGWKMCLGTLDLAPKTGKIRIGDKIGHFKGDIHSFFIDIYGKDAIVREELDSIKRPDLPWLDDVVCTSPYGMEADLRYLSSMLDEGNFIVTNTTTFQWADYRWVDGARGSRGGYYTIDELKYFFNSFKKITPRARAFNYSITVAGTIDSPIVNEHPEYFRKYDRNGEIESHFPGVLTNYQTRMQIPEVRKFMANHLFDMAKRFGLELVYLDEAQQQNTIDWERGDAIRDDHLVEVFREMRRRSVEDKIACFYNGSGLPYADINYIEALDQLKRENWRNFAGVAFGLELFSLLAPDSRIVPIYANIKDNDVSNRLIALGWLPTPRSGGMPISIIRAAREVGKSFPTAIDYTPDWKKDFSVDVESYSVRRKDCSDVIVSFINRKNEAATLDVQVDLASTGFNAEQRINVWALTTRNPSGTVEYWLSNAEYREQSRTFNWYDGFISSTQLIYSGKPEGMLEHQFRSLPVDFMGQLVVTASPMALFALDGLPFNFFFTNYHGTKITGSQFVSNHKEAELLLADRELLFEDIRLDDQPIQANWIDVGGTLFQKITVPGGKHVVSYNTTARTEKRLDTVEMHAVFDPDSRIIRVSGAPENTLFALEYQGRTRLTSTSPLHLPERYENGEWQLRAAGTAAPSITLQLSNGKKSSVQFQPRPHRQPKRSDEPCDLTVNGVQVKHAASEVLFPGTPLRDLQENLDPAAAFADPQKLMLSARSTRREDTLDARFYAGFEITGSKELALRLTSYFYGQYGPGGFRNHVYGMGIPKIDFAGMIIDYRVNGKYTKRLAVSFGIGGKALKNALPSWGCGKEYDSLVTLGDLICQAKITDFRFPVMKYAPENWDGTFFISIGCTHVLPARGFELEILGGDGTYSNFPLMEAVALEAEFNREVPAALELGRLASVPNADNLLSFDRKLPDWVKLPPMLPLPRSASKQVQKVQGYFAYDDDALYFIGEADEVMREIRLNPNVQPWENDALELYFTRPGKAALQIVIDAAGKLALLENGIPLADRGNIVCKVQVKPNHGFRVFAKIPWSLLDIKEITPGLTVKYNLARSRRGTPSELSCTAPVKILFNESDHFGSFHLGKEVKGTGRFDEFFVK